MKRSSRRTASVLASLAATLSLLAVPAGASAAFDFPKIKAWWPLAEGRGQTVMDWSGNGNHGTLGSTPGVDSNDPTWVKGIFNTNALNFGGDDFVAIRDSNALRLPSFTVSMWVRSASSPGAFSYLLSKGSDECTSASWAISTGNNGGLQSYVWDGNTQKPSGGAEPAEVWNGKWHNVAMTYDGTSTRLFLDGRDLGAGVGNANPVDYDLPDPGATLGGYRGSCDLFFTGDIDQVMVFDRPLPMAEIWDRWGWLLNKPSQG
jgi:hypothetical protein